LDGDVHDMSTESVLNKAASADCNELLQAMSLTLKKPTTVLEREVDDVWVNNYSPNVLCAWNADKDITSYITNFSSIPLFLVNYFYPPTSNLRPVFNRARKALRPTWLLRGAWAVGL